MLSGNIYSQSSDYEKYYNQIMQKLQKFGTEIDKDLETSTKLAMMSTHKDMYVLYLNGNQMGCFSDEWTCKAKIQNLKSQYENLTESLIKEFGANFSSNEKAELRKIAKTDVQNMNFSYRKEANPNYKEPISYNIGNIGNQSNPQFNNNGNTGTANTSATRTSIFDNQPETQQNNQAEKKNTPDNSPSIRTLTNTETPTNTGIRIHERTNTEQENIRFQNGIDSLKLIKSELIKEQSFLTQKCNPKNDECSGKELNRLRELSELIKDINNKTDKLNTLFEKYEKWDAIEYSDNTFKLNNLESETNKKFVEFTECIKRSTGDCPTQKKAFDSFNERLEAKKEWITSLESKTEPELQQLKNEYKTLADMATISEFSYSYGKELPKGYEPVNNKELTEIVYNANCKVSDFECVLVKNGNNYVLSFRGTDNVHDVISGWTGKYSSGSPQASNAITVTDEIIKKIAKIKNIGEDSVKKILITTGHSLGGHLAAEAALNNGLGAAYTFNSMDISNTTKEKIIKGEINADNVIKNTMSVNDILNGTPAGMCNVGKNADNHTSTFNIGEYDKNNPVIKEHGNIGYELKNKTISYATNLVIKENNFGHGMTDLKESLIQCHQDIKTK